MKRLPLCLCAFCLCLTAAAQIISVTPSSLHSGIYERNDIRVTLKGEWNNPFREQEARLDMFVRCPSGGMKLVPAFFVSEEADGQSIWEARFTPQQTGTYEYFFRYAQSGLESLSAVNTLSVTEAEGHGFLHTSDNWTLAFDDGTPFRGIGENICWESRTSDDSRFFKELHEQHERFSYTAMLPKFAANGGNFIRIWMCPWNFPIDRKSDFNNSRYSDSDSPINESAVLRLDETVRLCEQLGIKIMLCMGAGEAATDAHFFASGDARAEYRNRLRYIVARWGYSTAIAMWEFFNETDNIQFADSANPIPAADITHWHTDMSAYLKSIDPYGHIVTTSISHRDIEGLNSVPCIDINQKHIYRGTSSIPTTIYDYEKRFGKPYVIGEFSREWDWSLNFDDFAHEMKTDFRRGLWYGLFCPTPLTPMSWWWEYFDDRDMVRYFRAPSLVNALMLEKGKGGFESVRTDAGKAQSFAVRCGECTFVYVFNPSGTVVRTVNVDAKGTLSELDIENVQWKRISHIDGLIKTAVAPNSEKVFVIE